MQRRTSFSSLNGRRRIDLVSPRTECSDGSGMKKSVSHKFGRRMQGKELYPEDLSQTATPSTTSSGCGLFPNDVGVNGLPKWENPMMVETGATSDARSRQSVRSGRSRPVPPPSSRSDAGSSRPGGGRASVQEEVFLTPRSHRRFLQPTQAGNRHEAHETLNVNGQGELEGMIVACNNSGTDFVADDITVDDGSEADFYHQPSTHVPPFRPKSGRPGGSRQMIPHEEVTRRISSHNAPVPNSHFTAHTRIAPKSGLKGIPRSKSEEGERKDPPSHMLSTSTCQRQVQRGYAHHGDKRSRRINEMSEMLELDQQQQQRHWQENEGSGADFLQAGGVPEAHNSRLFPANDVPKAEKQVWKKGPNNTWVHALSPSRGLKQVREDEVCAEWMSKRSLSYDRGGGDVRYSAEEAELDLLEQYLLQGTEPKLPHSRQDDMHRLSYSCHGQDIEPCRDRGRDRNVRVSPHIEHYADDDLVSLTKSLHSYQDAMHGRPVHSPDPSCASHYRYPDRSRDHSNLDYMERSLLKSSGHSSSHMRQRIYGSHSQYDEGDEGSLTESLHNGRDTGRWQSSHSPYSQDTSHGRNHDRKPLSRLSSHSTSSSYSYRQFYEGPPRDPGNQSEMEQSLVRGRIAAPRDSQPILYDYDRQRGPPRSPYRSGARDRHTDSNNLSLNGSSQSLTLSGSLRDLEYRPVVGYLNNLVPAPTRSLEAPDSNLSTSPGKRVWKRGTHNQWIRAMPGEDLHNSSGDMSEETRLNRMEQDMLETALRRSMEET